MLKLKPSLAALSLMALPMVGCFFDDFGAGITVPPSVEDDEPYVRALLDSNGLQDVPLYDVIKLDDPFSRTPTYYLSLGNRNLKEFRFIANVDKIKAISTISLVSNEISQVPIHISVKKWAHLWLDRNKLCGLSQNDSLILKTASVTWDDQSCPPDSGLIRRTSASAK